MKVEYNNHASKSHTGEELIRAFKTGEKIWILNSGTSGNDDILVGEKEEIIADLLCFFNIEKIPINWKLRQAQCEIIDGELNIF